MNAFISVCPVCIHAHPKIPKSKGARCPIHSGKFRDRMQIDLIDYCANEQRNVYGQVMQWIMVVKDHFTGLVCYLRSIPNENAKYVCFELNSLFGLIGYPHIFHTDNGSEFTAEQVVGMLKRWNQTKLTVTGRPRKPSDQVSVENIKRLACETFNEQCTCK